jgi:hypothetical protein
VFIFLQCLSFARLVHSRYQSCDDARRATDVATRQSYKSRAACLPFSVAPSTVVLLPGRLTAELLNVYVLMVYTIRRIVCYQILWDQKE